MKAITVTCILVLLFANSAAAQKISIDESHKFSGVVRDLAPGEIKPNSISNLPRVDSRSNTAGGGRLGARGRSDNHTRRNRQPIRPAIAVAGGAYFPKLVSARLQSDSSAIKT